MRWKRRRRRGIRRWKIKKRRSTFSSSRAAPYRSPALAGKLCFLKKKKISFTVFAFHRRLDPVLTVATFSFLLFFLFKFNEVQIGITPVPGGTGEIYKRAFNLLGGVNQGRGLIGQRPGEEAASSHPGCFSRP